MLKLLIFIFYFISLALGAFGYLIKIFKKNISKKYRILLTVLFIFFSLSSVGTFVLERLQERNLNNQLKEINQIATRNVFKPLSDEQINKTADSLKQILSKYSLENESIIFKVIINNNTIYKQKITMQLNNLFENAGFKIEKFEASSLVGWTPIKPYIKIFLKNENVAKGFADEVVGALQGYINVNIPTEVTKIDPPEFLGENKIIFNLFGEPEFSPDGVITFIK